MFCESYQFLYLVNEIKSCLVIRDECYRVENQVIWLLEPKVIWNSINENYYQISVAIIIHLNIYGKRIGNDK